MIVLVLVSSRTLLFPAIRCVSSALLIDYDDAAAQASLLSSKGVIVKVVPMSVSALSFLQLGRGMSVDVSPSQAMFDYAAKKGLDKDRAKRIVDVFEEVISS